jgi:hypothetical protein
MRAQIDFHLAGIATDQITAGQAHYFMHVLAYGLATGETIVLTATQGHLRPGVLDYTTTIEFVTPEVGHYQLLGTVVLPDYDILGVTVGPRLKVVP